MIDLEKAYRAKKILITGGLGFIGSNLARKLVKFNPEITLVDSLIPEYGGNLFNIEGIKKDIRLNIADVRDEHSMKYLIKGQDYLFNLAGQVSHIDSMEDPYTDLEINVRSQISILEACRKNNPEIKIIFASTRQIYGKPDYLPVDEKHPLHPADVNGINKLAGEWYHILYWKVYGIRTTSLRLTNTYGPRQLMKHNRQGFIGWFIRQIIEEKEIKIFGDGKQIRDLNYVDDVVEALLLAGTNENSNGKIFNLAGVESINLQDLVKLLINLYGVGSFSFFPFPPEKKKIDIGDFFGDYSKIKNTLGWEPKVSITEGLKRTIEYYKVNWRHYWEP